MRLDAYLVEQGLAASRRQARSLIAAGAVLVNGRLQPKGYTPAASDTIEVAATPAPSIIPNPALTLSILHAEPDFLIADKPGLLPCHPLRAQETETVINAVVARFPEVGGLGDKPLEGGLVHRLDNGTSGALLIARTQAAWSGLRVALRAQRLQRTYLALVEGQLEPGCELELAWAIAHDPRDRRRMLALEDPVQAARLKARPALTQVRALAHAARFTLLAITPKSGMRHQIRVHLHQAGLPIVGDTLYGGSPGPELEPGRFFLHLHELALPRELLGERANAAAPWLRIQAPMPQELRAYLQGLGCESLACVAALPYKLA